MDTVRLLATTAAVLCSISLSLAQSASATASTYVVGACPTVLSPPYEAPVVGSGWTAQLIATNLTKPRGIIFDQSGALLVVQQGSGIVRLTFTDYGGTCLVVNETTPVVENPDHVSRTLLLSTKVNNTLLVSRGSSQNMDLVAAQLDSGHSQVRSFDISSLPDGRPYNYPSDGRLMGWGLRNSVGVAEHPVTGGIYSVENSIDQAERAGVDIHEDNPGEEMNFLGFLNCSTEEQGGNYGYPVCFALWHPAGFPERGNMTVGSQFALNITDTFNDTTCAQNYIPPRLTFQAHTAPLDILFDSTGSIAYVTFHGSWDRTNPVGYVLSSVQFDNTTGEPVAAPDSTTATVDVLSNADLSKCPGSCFRPVGLAWDGQGRLFVSSDATGEVYVLQKVEFSASGGVGTGTGTGTASGTGSGTGTGTVVTSTSTSTSTSMSTGVNLAPRSSRNRPGGEAIWLTCLAVVLSLVCGVFFARF
ncbi:L-sorbosone dehydrogenase [Cytospora mali]|uniref:L-sorbosone dehydrogenase n=1 Tax=Cytospora mali TaxID=578113 RepID=A0A194UPJ6_CYTMA|nr:L-sorbosone dehydrogenase [Valsa mali var. pyri (nom. inval.)]